MKTFFASLVAVFTIVFPITSASPVFDAATEHFSYDFLEEPLLRLTSRQSSNGSLPDATGLSYIVPAPPSTGGKAWQTANARASALVAQMTLQEKVGKRSYLTQEA